MKVYDPALVGLLVPGMVGRDDHQPHQGPARGLRAHHAARRQLRRGPLRPPRPAGLRHLLHGGRALPGLRRHLRRRRGLLPRRRRRPGQQAPADRRRASTSTSTSTTATTRSRPTRSPWSATARRSASSTSSCSRRSNNGPYLQDSSQIAPSRTPAPRSPTTELLTHLDEHRRVGATSTALQTTVAELGTAFAGTGQDLQRIIDTGNSFIKTANDNFDTTTALIKDGNTVLQRPDRLDVGDPDLRPRPVAVQRHAGGLGQGPARGDRQRVGHRQPAAHVPPGQPGRPRPS